VARASCADARDQAPRELVVSKLAPFD